MSRKTTLIAAAKLILELESEVDGNEVVDEMSRLRLIGQELNCEPDIIGMMQISCAWEDTEAELNEPVLDVKRRKRPVCIR